MAHGVSATGTFSCTLSKPMFWSGGGGQWRPPDYNPGTKCPPYSKESCLGHYLPSLGSTTRAAQLASLYSQHL